MRSASRPPLPLHGPSGRPLPPALERIAVPLALALALALRLREALRAPLWYDELYSLAAAARPLRDVLAVAHADVHPPLHFVLEWAWRHVAHSDLAIRSLSLVFGMGALLATWALGRSLFGARAALTATLLLALHPAHVFGSQEARSYALLWCFLAAAWFAAWRWAESARPRDGALFIVAAALAMWTHYLAAPALAASFAWGVARFARTPDRLRGWLGLHAGVALAFAPQLPVAWEQVHRPIGALGGRFASVHALAETARRFAFGRALLWIEVLPCWLIAFRDRPRRPGAGFAAAIGPLLVLGCWLAAAGGARVFTPKYMMMALPGGMLLLAAGLERLPSRAARIVVTLSLALAAARAAWVTPPQPEAAAFARVLGTLRGEVRPGDFVFHADTHTLLFGERDLPQAIHRLDLGEQPLPFFEGAAVLPAGVLADTAEVARAAARGARWWALAARPAGIDVRDAAARFTRAAEAPAETLGVVRLWRGAAVR
jgi:hypothetical protein